MGKFTIQNWNGHLCRRRWRNVFIGGGDRGHSYLRGTWDFVFIKSEIYIDEKDSDNTEMRTINSLTSL